MGDRVVTANRRRGTRLGLAGSGALIVIGVLMAPAPAEVTPPEPAPPPTAAVVPNAGFAGVQPWRHGSKASMAVVRSGSSPVGQVRRTGRYAGTIHSTSEPSRATFAVGTRVRVSARLRSTGTRGHLVLRVYERAADGSTRQRQSSSWGRARKQFRAFTSSLVVKEPGSRVFVRFEHSAAARGKSLHIKNVQTDVTLPGEVPAQPDPSTPTPTPTATPSPTPSPTGPPAPTTCRDRDYRDPDVGRLSFADEFSGSSLDTSKWRVRDKDHLSFDAAYLQKENVTVSGGKLTIAGRRMSSPKAVSTGLRERWYSTGYVDTIGKFSQKYGRWEMRAKLPTDGTRTRGVWPAFWLRGDRTAGEIDIMETYGSPDTQDRWNPSNTYEATIWRDTNVGGKDKWHARSGPFDQSPAVYEDWHVYGLNWSPECLTFTYDDRVIAHVAVKDVPWMAAALDSPFNIRLNMQVGSSYWGMPDATHTKPAFDYVIDYVRAYAPVS